MTYKMRLASSVAFGIFAATSAFAQTAEPAPARTSTEESASSLDIVVTAQRREERLVDVPLTVLSSNAEQLQAAGVTSTKDLGLVVPGLSFTTMGAWANPAIRGVTTTITAPGGESPVAIYIDGVYQPSQQGTFTDLPDISHIEVSKGPQGTLFGRNATGGAIAIFTRNPTYDLTGSFSAETGMWMGGHDTYKGISASFKGFISGGLSETLAASLSGYYSTDPGYMRDEVTGGHYGRARTYSTRGKLMWEPSDSVKFLLTGFYSNRYDQPTVTGTPIDNYSLAFGDPNGIVTTRPWHIAFDRVPTDAFGGKPGFEVKNYGGSLRGEFSFDAGTLTSITAVNNTLSDIMVNVDGARSPACYATFACANYQVLEPSRMVSQEFDFASRKFGIFSFVAGAYLYRERAEIKDIVNGLEYLHQYVQTKSWAVFAEGSADLSDSLHAIAGIRYSKDRKTLAGSYGPLVAATPTRTPANPCCASWDAFTPRFSVRYDVNDHANVYFTFSRGFKSGLFDASTFNTPPLKPETLTSFEAGVKMSYANFTFNLSGFLYDYKDLQIEVFTGLAATQLNADARLRGLDADASFRLSEDLTLRVAGSWLPYAKYRGGYEAADQIPATPGLGGGLVLDFQDADGNRMIKAPKVTASATLAYSNETDAGTFGTNISLYHSGGLKWQASDTPKFPYTRAYTTLAGDVSFKPASFPVKFTLFGKNLTNKAYIQGTLISGQGAQGYYSSPRQLGLRAEYTF